MIGRSGRDGRPATAAILHHPNELKSKGLSDAVRSIAQSDICVRNHFLKSLDSVPSAEKVPERLCCTICAKSSRHANNLFIPSAPLSRRRVSRESIYAKRKVIFQTIKS